MDLVEQNHPELAFDEVDEEHEYGFDTHGFATGDMVWAKVPWLSLWPGRIYNELLVPPGSVRSAKQPNGLLVTFFGDDCYGWFNPATLIPYEAEFLRISRRPNKADLVRALNESIDEVGRRAALGLSCRCRNPNRFRPTHVPNYFDVEVVGHEVANGGQTVKYSRRQIMKERESFKPREILSFLQQVAVMERGSEIKNVEWHRRESAVLALRRTRYEEFDETYAQAFGQEPVRPVRNNMGMIEQAENIAPRVAPLSGTNKQQLITKQFCNKEKVKARISSSAAAASASKSNKHVAKGRDGHPTAAIKPKPAAFIDGSATNNVVGSPPQAPAVVSGSTMVKKKKKKKNKRSIQEVNSHKEEAKGRSMVVEKKEREQKTTTYAVLPPPTPNMGLSSLRLSDVLADLAPVSLYPFQNGSTAVAPLDNEPKEEKKPTKLIKRTEVSTSSGQKRNSLDQQVELSSKRMKKLSQLKSITSKKKTIKKPEENQEITTAAPNQTIGEPKDKEQKKADDLTSSGQKRAPSGRDEELPAKRMKKRSQLRSKAVEKKTSLSIKKTSSEEPATMTKTQLMIKKPMENQETNTAGTTQLKKTPTVLILKFPTGSTLPSVSSLKARFARFGPLEVERTRVFWNTHSCKVQFQYKPDALKALSFVKSNEVFGPIKVDHYIKEFEAPQAELTLKSPKLKSILKKPADQVAKEILKVKFVDVVKSAVDVAPAPLRAPQLKSVMFQVPPQPLRSRQAPPAHAVGDRAPSVHFSEGPGETRAVPVRSSGREGGVDISHRMLSLLVRCNNIVSGLNALPGFVPYKPL